MSLRTLTHKMTRLEKLARLRFRNNQALLEQLRSEPSRLMEVSGTPPDPWQHELLQSDAQRMLLLCSRQTKQTQDP
jgi:hypothetical protein